MWIATGKAYNKDTINSFADLLAWMLAEEPYIRPSAEQVFNQLCDILDKYSNNNKLYQNII
jgi:hypothetical protein